MIQLSKSISSLRLSYKALATAVLLFMLLSTGCKSIKAPQETHRADDPDIRPVVKEFIDELYDSKIIDVEHTTRGINEPSMRTPKEPKPFLAGRYKVSFIKDGVQRAIICQTEEVVGHLGEVIPGKTVVGGYVQLLDDPSDPLGAGPKINPQELDYLIETLYKKFDIPLDHDQETFLNEAKDFALAIKFNGKKGILDYHNKLVK